MTFAGLLAWWAAIEPEGGLPRPEGSPTAGRPTAGGVTAGAAADERARPTAAKARRISAGERAELVKLIETLRAEREASGEASMATLDADAREPSDYELDLMFVAEQLDELGPIVERCYRETAAERPEGKGSIELELTLDGEPDAGALVRELRVVESTLGNAALGTCLVETMSALELPAPLLGGSRVVRHSWGFGRVARPDTRRVFVMSSLTTFAP